MGIFHTQPPSFIGGAQPYAPRRLSPSFLAIPEDEPPRQRALVVLAAVLVSWAFVPAIAQPRRHIRIIEEAAQQQTLLRYQQLPLQLWAAGYPKPGQIIRRLSPSIIDVPVNFVEGGGRFRDGAILSSWIPRVEIRQPRRYAASVTAVPEDLPIPRDRRSWLPSVLTAWEPGPATPPITTRYLSQAGPVVEENPSFSGPWLASLLASWEAPPPTPQLARRLPASVLAVTEDAPVPRYGRLSREDPIDATWAIPAYIPHQRGRLFQHPSAIPDPLAQLQMLQATITVVPDILMAASVSEEFLAKVESTPTIAIGKIQV